MTKTQTIQNNRIQARYTLDGRIVQHSANFTDRVSLAQTIKNNYFENEINRFPDKNKWSFGIGPSTAALEIGIAGALAWKTPSAATMVNALTSGAEFIETLIGGTHIIEDRKERELRLEVENCQEPEKKRALEKTLNEKKNEKGRNLWDFFGKGSEQKAEMVISTLQLLSGLIGGIQTAFSLFKKFITGEHTEEKQTSLFDKIWLSGASLLNAGLMLFASGEKNLIASLVENRGLEENDPIFEQGGSIRVNARSDFRCFLEWTGMTFFTWFKDLSFKGISVKDIFDIVISSKATWEGSEYYRHYNLEETEKPAKNLMENIFGWSIGKLTYLGTESVSGLRKSLVIPVLELFGCNPPEIYIDGNEVVCEVEAETNADELSEKSLTEINPWENPVEIPLLKAAMG